MMQIIKDKLIYDFTIYDLPLRGMNTFPIVRSMVTCTINSIVNQSYLVNRPIVN